MKALIVDDEPSLAALMQEALRRIGWEVTTANSLKDAQHKIGPFDVVVAMCGSLTGTVGIFARCTRDAVYLHVGLPRRATGFTEALWPCCIAVQSPRCDKAETVVRAGSASLR